MHLLKVLIVCLGDIGNEGGSATGMGGEGLVTPGKLTYGSIP